MSRGRRLVLEPGPLAHQPRRIASTIDRERPTISPEGSESNLVTASAFLVWFDEGHKL